MSARARVNEVYDDMGRPIVLDELIGQGGDGTVYAARHAELAVKVWHKRMLARQTTVRELIARGAPDSAPQTGFAWPVGLVFDDSGCPCGYTMPLLTGGYVRLDQLMTAAGRSWTGQLLSWDGLLLVTERAARLVAALEEAALVHSDLAPANFMVQAHDLAVRIVDCDAISAEHDTPLRTLRPEIAAPELIHGSTVPALAAQMRWALAVLSCRTLMEGDHPFLGVPARRGEPRGDVLTNIAAGATRFNNRAALRLPRAAMPLELLPVDVRELAASCFVAGASDERVRPSAADWAARLTNARLALACCRCWPAGHRFAGHLQQCPWCRREAEGQPNPYPFRPRWPRHGRVPPLPVWLARGMR